MRPLGQWQPANFQSVGSAVLRSYIHFLKQRLSPSVRGAVRRSTRPVDQQLRVAGVSLFMLGRRMRNWFSFLGPRNSDLGVRWQAADAALAIGDQVKAAKIYKSLSDMRCTSESEFLYAGLALQRLGAGTKAITVLRSGIAAYPLSDTLSEHFVRVCCEQGQAAHAVQELARQQGIHQEQLCSFLLKKYPDSQIQASIIDYAFSHGLNAVAEQHLRHMDGMQVDTAGLWRLADILLSHERNAEARTIYGRLSVIEVSDPLSAIHRALSLYRLGRVAEAADKFEESISRFSAAGELIEHYARICAQLRQMGRVLNVIRVQGESIEDTCSAALNRFEDPQIRVGLVDYLLENGHAEIAEPYVAEMKGAGDTLSLWQIGELLLHRDRKEEATEIFRTLSKTNPVSEEDYHLVSLALVCISELDECLVKLESGLLVFPSAAKLMALYVKICAKRFEYDRYKAFLASVDLEQLPPPLSMLDFYRASMSAPVDFVINLQEIALRFDSLSLEQLKSDFVVYLKTNPQQLKIAKVIVFFCGYLDLPSAFSSAVFEALCADGGLGEEGRRSLQILHRLTPPMIPREPVSAREIIEKFTAAGVDESHSSIVLNEPIADMTNNWTPWQYIFCLNAPEQYSKAISALESVAFQAWPKLDFTAAHVSAPASQASRKLRVGFIVHDSMPMMSGFLPQLDPTLFETVYLRPGQGGTSETALSWITRAGKTVEYSDSNMYEAIETIADQQLDIIVSGPSIAAVFYPMMARLAKLQMVLLEPNWTDGLANADYYLSWSSAEPEEPGLFYQTNVAFFRDPPYWFERPALSAASPVSESERADIRSKLLNVGPDETVYLCANTPPKIHPEMDEVFDLLLRRDPKAVLVLLRGEYPPAKTLRARLREKLGAAFERVRFVSTMDKDRAHALLQAVDCCIDSFPISGMSSSFDGAMLGIPVVTLPSNIPFGNWTAAIYKFLGVEGLTASTKAEYVDLAISLAGNETLRRDMGRDIAAKSARLLSSNTSTANQLQGFLLDAWNRAQAGLEPQDWIEGQWRSRAPKSANV